MQDLYEEALHQKQVSLKGMDKYCCVSIYFYYEHIMALHSKTHIRKIRLHNHRSKCSHCNQHKYSLWRNVQRIFQMSIHMEIWSL